MRRILIVPSTNIIIMVLLVRMDGDRWMRNTAAGNGRCGASLGRMMRTVRMMVILSLQGGRWFETGTGQGGRVPFAESR